ncbi:MAG: outer membrane protein assembly factor BamE, partial [Pseudomonadota bacterium]
PEPVEREVVVVSFGADDVVTNVERYGLEDGRVIALSRRVTDGPEQDSTFLRQLLGSIGRFDPTQLLGDS